jgi:hypothetical protein
MEKFRSEKERIDYYKKLHLKNNAIAQQTTDKLTEAYHEVEFGVVPQIEDNRSLAEKLADARSNQDQAQKNTLMLMANDGAEANRLLNLIGTARYSDFNRYFLDIYNTLKNQVGRIQATEAYTFIDNYLIKATVTNGVDIPNVEMLNQLLAAIAAIPAGPAGPAAPAPATAPAPAPAAPAPAGPVQVNVDMRDVVLRLEALQQVLAGGVDTLNRVEYNTRNLPSGQDILDATTFLRDAISNVGDQVGNVGNQVRNEGVGASLRFNEVMEYLRLLVNSIDAESLESVVSDLTDDTEYEDEFYNAQGDEDEFYDTQGDEDEFYDTQGDEDDLFDNIISRLEGLTGDEDDGVLPQVVDSVVDNVEQTMGVQISEEVEMAMAAVIAQIKTRGVSNVVDNIVQAIEQQVGALPADVKDDISVQTTDTLKEKFGQLGQKTKDVGDNNDRMNMYHNSYAYVMNNIHTNNFDISKMRTNLLFLFKVNDLSVKSLNSMKTRESIQGLLTEEVKTKLERTGKYIARKQKDSKTVVYSNDEKQAMRMIEMYIQRANDDVPEKDLSDEYIETLNRTRNTLKGIPSEQLKKYVDKNDPIFQNYIWLANNTEDKDPRKGRITYGKIKNVLNRSPYTFVYDYLAKQYGEPLKRARPLTPDTSFVDFDRDGASSVDFVDFGDSEDERSQTKSGNGMKKWKSIMKKRVY